MTTRIFSRKVGAAMLLLAAFTSLTGCAAQRYTAYRPALPNYALPNYEAGVEARMPLDGTDKPEIVARLTLTPRN